MNASIKCLLFDLYTTPTPSIIPDTEAAAFRQWLENQQFDKLGESLSMRCTAVVQELHILCNFDYLYHNLLAYCNKADLHINRYEASTEHIFASLLETIALYLHFPSNEGQFTEDITSINHTVKEKIKRLLDLKTTIPQKNAEYARIYNELDTPDIEKAPQLLYEILLAENELRQFLFANTDIPLCYLLYFIALDEFGHFTPIVRQAAMYGLRHAQNDFLWQKFVSLRSDYFKIYPVYIPVLPDITVHEFAHSIGKALRFLDAEYDTKTVFEIAHAIFETIPDCHKFLYHYPLTVSNAPGTALLSHQWTSCAYRSFHDIQDKNHTIKRFIEILDYTLPNSRGIPSILFKDKELALPFVRREYLRSTGVDNEAELRLRSVIDPYFPPKFVHTQNPRKARDLVSNYLTFLELYAQGENTIVSPQGHSITRDDIAMMIERHFDLSAITAENILHAQIMLWYIEPIQSIFNISEATEETLAAINEYIESIYGKPLSIEAAKEKALEVIAQENEHITALNHELDGNTKDLWQPLQEGSYQWNKLYSILVRRFTHRDTLTLWELKGILYDMREEKRPKPFYYPVTAAIGKAIQKTISKALRSYEKTHPQFIKVRKWLYNYLYAKLDHAEKNLDVCGWKEYSGVCLRRDRNCCSIPFSSPCLTPTGCNSKALACKFWLCSAARSRLAATKKGRQLFAKRRLYSYWCQTFNIPLKVRCSMLNSFDDKAKEPLADISAPDWFDVPLTPYSN